MGTRSTVKGYWRQGGAAGSNKRTPASVPSILTIQGLDATVDAGTGTGRFLPKGAIPLEVWTVETVTASGGTTPILDIGLELSTPDDNGLADGLAYDASTHTVFLDALGGVLLGTVLAETAEVTYGDDGVGTNNTAGEIDIYIMWVMADDGVVND